MKNNIHRHCGRAALSLMLICALAACSEDVPDIPVVEPQPEVTEVPLTISLGSVWNIGTGDDDTSRAAPPGTGGNNDPAVSADGDEETKNVDKVRVVTFKRKDADSDMSVGNAAKAAVEPFKYDVTNDFVLDVEEGYTGGFTDKFPGPHNHKVAKGTLKKVYGYEYRVVAIAYDSKRQSSFSAINKSEACTFAMPDGEDNWFNLNCSDDVSFEEFMAAVRPASVENKESSWMDFISGYPSGLHIPEDDGVLSNQVVEMPQMFFGECYTEHDKTRSEVIKYSVTNAGGDQVKDLAVRGVLYRGLAKVELHITPVSKKGITKAYPVKWICLMADNVFTRVGLSDYDDFLTPHSEAGLGKQMFSAVAYCDVEAVGEKVITAYFLPCKTRLAVRIKTDDGDVRNALLTTADRESTGNGTGIISPDLHDDVFYLRRNHKYVLRVSDSEALFTSNQIK